MSPPAFAEASAGKPARTPFAPRAADTGHGRAFEPLPKGKFATIFADPPWAFRTWSGKIMTPHRSAADHYATVPTPMLASLPVASVAARDCALILWIVDSHLVEAIELARAWGFRFSTRLFTWVKTGADGATPRMSFGYWTRKQSELALLFVRGHPKRLSRGVPEVILAPRAEHSRKPDEAYARAQALLGGPYLELFARTRRPGWEAWGDQVGRFG